MFFSISSDCPRNFGKNSLHIYWLIDCLRTGTTSIFLQNTLQNSFSNDTEYYKFVVLCIIWLIAQLSQWRNDKFIYVIYSCQFNICWHDIHLSLLIISTSLKMWCLLRTTLISGGQGSVRCVKSSEPRRPFIRTAPAEEKKMITVMRILKAIDERKFFKLRSPFT